METRELTVPENVQTVLRIVTWCLFAFAGTWLVTSLIGYFHRRAYNLTRAESGPSKNIKPDFLTVDKAKRQAAIERGNAYTAVLEEREAAAEPAVSPAVKKAHHWSWFLATTAAVVGLITTAIGSLAKIDQMQADVVKITSWDKFSHLVGQNQAGAIVAVAVIGANVIVVAQKIKKPAAS
jgi:uncharacterized membrane protein